MQRFTPMTEAEESTLAEGGLDLYFATPGVVCQKGLTVGFQRRRKYTQREQWE